MTLKGFILPLCLLLILPSAALAHSPVEGMDHVFSGLLHPLLVPAHLLALLACGLYFGQQQVNRYQRVLLAYVLAVIAGLAAAWFIVMPALESLLLVMTTLTGLLVVANITLHRWGYTVLAVATGLTLGLDSSQTELAGVQKTVWMLGAGIGLTLFMFYVMGLADQFRQKAWQQIGIRVLGSWLTASAMLVLVLQLQ